MVGEGLEVLQQRRDQGLAQEGRAVELDAQVLRTSADDVEAVLIDGVEECLQL